MKTTYLISFAFILLVSFNLQSDAFAMLCDIETDELWINGNDDSWLTENHISANCTCDGTNAWVDLIDDSSSHIARANLENASGYYSGNLFLENTLPPGDYVINSYCNSTSGLVNESTALKINRLSSKLISNAPQIIYPEDVLDFDVELKKNGQSIVSGATFDLYLGDTLLPLQGTPLSTANYWKIKAEVPRTFTDYGIVDLRIIARYSDQPLSSTSYDYSEVKPLVSVNILEPPIFSPYRLTDTENVEIKVEVLHKSNTVDKSDISGFEAKLDGTEVKIEEVDYIDDRWILTVNIPKLGPREKPYPLDIYANYRDMEIESSNSVPIQFVIPFEGTLSNSKGSPAANVDIRLRSSNFEEKCTTDNTGHYSTVIPSGTYDIEVSFAEFRAKLIDVKLESPDDSLLAMSSPIQYDYFSGGAIKAKKVVVLEFTLPFDRAQIVIPYTSSDFSDEQDIMVFQCENWNFEKRTCKGTWENIDAPVDTERNLISLYTSDLCAFAISESKNIKMDISLDKEKYYLGEKVNLNGKVLDAELDAVSDATITYTAGDISGKVTSDSSGNFFANFNAPDTAGTFELDVTAEKEPYAAKKSISFSTYRKKALSISAPSSIDLDLDAPVFIKLVVKNTGQTPIQNIKIYLSGIPPEWYKPSSSEIDHLETNEEQEIEISVLLPEKQCENGCRQKYTLEINAEADDVKAIAGITLNVNGNETAENPESHDDGSKTNDTHLTGLLTFIKATREMATTVIIILAILLVARKKRTTKDSSRHLLTQTVKEVKNEVLKTENKRALTAREGTSKNEDEKKNNDIENMIMNPFSKNKEIINHIRP